jgi:deoxyhypusine synthase
LDNKEESILYWAYKNDIPIFCPALTDGTIGNFLYVEMIKHKDYYIDIVGDHKKIIDFVLSCEKTGAILLGGGTPKHYVLNANIYRDGVDYAVYITTANELDASDSGGNAQEAITWAKLKVNALNVKVHAEASLVFPLLVASTFKKKFDREKHD